MMDTSADFAGQFDANTRLLRRLAGQLVETVLTDKSAMFSGRRRHAAGAGLATDPLLHELRAATAGTR